MLHAKYQPQIHMTISAKGNTFYDVLFAYPGDAILLKGVYS